MDAETLTEPERRVALLDWLARGRDVRIAAELCGEKHAWAKAVAQAAGHPDRDQIRQALAAAKAELHPPRQLLKPDSVAPTRPIRAALVEHVAGYADGMALRKRTPTTGRPRGTSTSVLVEVAARFARLVSRTGVEDYQDGTGSRLPIPGDGAHRPGKLVRDEVHARNNARKATGNAKWSGLLVEGAIEAHAADDLDELRQALLDTAATAVAWIHALDHRGAPDDDTPATVVSSEPRSQLLELLDEVTVAHTAHMLARLDVGKARRAGLNDALDEAIRKADQASKAVTAAELRARAAVVRHLPPGATA